MVNKTLAFDPAGVMAGSEWGTRVLHPWRLSPKKLVFSLKKQAQSLEPAT
jgi:hypothetical protein